MTNKGDLFMIEKIIEFYSIVNNLKNTIRTGWTEVYNGWREQKYYIKRIIK